MSKLAAMDISRSSSDRGGSPALSRFWLTSRGLSCCCGWAGGGAALEAAGAISLSVLPVLSDLEWMWPKGARAEPSKVHIPSLAGAGIGDSALSSSGSSGSSSTPAATAPARSSANDDGTLPPHVDVTKSVTCRSYCSTVTYEGQGRRCDARQTAAACSASWSATRLIDWAGGRPSLGPGGRARFG